MKSATITELPKTKSQEEIIIDEYRKGTPIAKIKTDLQIGHQTIFHILSKNSIELRSKSKVKRDEEIIRLWEITNLTMSEIASQTNLPHSIIASVIRTHSNHRRIKPKKTIDLENKRISELYKKGHSGSEIAKILNLPLTTIGNRLWRNNQYRRSRKETHKKHLLLFQKYYSGEKLADIAKNVGYAGSGAVTTAIRRLGFKPNRKNIK